MIPELSVLEKMEEIKTIWNETVINPHNCIDYAIKSIKKGRILSAASMVKKQGIPVIALVKDYLAFRLTGATNIAELVLKKNTIAKKPYGKDALYRLLNKSTIEWKIFLYLFSKGLQRSLADDIQVVTDKTRCFIIDDTVIKKRGTTIEGVSYVHDHVTGQTVLGYKLATASYHDGSSLYPLLFSVHSEGKGKKIHEYTKTDTALHWIQKICRSELPVDYVLCDSWYLTKEMVVLLDELRKQDKKHPHVVAKAKTNLIMTIEGKDIRLQKYIPVIRNKMKRCRSVHAQYYTKDAVYGSLPVRLFFVRCKGTQKIQVMITSNTELSFIEAFKIYAKRWSTEVMYKETKQLLRIQECQSTSLAHQHAHIAMTLVLYSLLSSLKSSEHYYTLGGVFSEIKQNLSSQTVVMKMWCAFIALLQALAAMIKKLHHCDGLSAVFSIFDAISMLMSSFSQCSFATG